MVLNPRCEIWNYFDNIVEEGVAVCKLCKQRLKNERSYSLRKHINKLHNPNSEIWKHFDNVVDECVAVCKICKKRVRNNRHFNLILHLKQHDIVIVEIVDKESKSKNVSSKKSNYSSKSNNETQPVERIRGNLYIEMGEKKLVAAVMGLMIEENLDPQIFGSKNMQALLDPMSSVIAKQQATKFNIDEIQSKKVLSTVANHIRNEFCNDFYWRLLSLKIDMDLNAPVKSFCLSVQYIQDIKVENRNLAVITLADDEQLSAQHIKPVLHQFNIDTNQIVSACWDNTKEQYNHSVTNSEYLIEIENFNKNPDINLGDIKIERYIGVIAQLCVMDVLKNPNIFKLFLECRNLVKMINDEANIFYVLFKENNLKIPQLDSPWKWGSTYSMLNDLKEARSVLENITYEQVDQEEDQFDLNENLLDFTDAFCKSLSSLQKSLLKFYNDEMIFGDFYIQWLKCKLLTQKLLKSHAKQGNNLEVILTELVKSIENRSNELLNQDHFKACLFLDPRLQHTLNLPEKMFAIEYLKQLWDRSKIYNAELVDPIAENKNLIALPDQQPDDDDEDACLNEFLCQGIHDAETSGIYKKLEELKLPFLNTNTNILSFWKDQKASEPQLYTLSTVCFAMPATQIYSKIRYSQHYYSIQNSKDKSYVKGNLAFIRLNEHLLDGVIQTLGLFREDDSSDNEQSDISEDNSESLSTITDTITVSVPSTSTGANDILRNIVIKSEIEEIEID